MPNVQPVRIQRKCAKGCDVKERPIVFSDEMVRAILDGRKTQTRHEIKVPPGGVVPYFDADGNVSWHCCGLYVGKSKAYAKVGERLWVREKWCSPSAYIIGYFADGECGAWIGDGGGGRIWNPHGVLLESPAYASRFDNDQRHTTQSLRSYGGKWRPSVHMPRWYSRITLEITGVRVERLQEIAMNDDDLEAEGILFDLNEKCVGPCPGDFTLNMSEKYKALWEKANGKGSWAANPYVWVIEFKRAKGCE